MKKKHKNSGFFFPPRWQNTFIQKSPVELEELKESNKFSLLPTSPPLNFGYELLWL